MDDGDDVDGADVRVQPVVDGEIDALDRRASAREQRVGERALRPGEREDRAVVVGIGVGFGRQQARAGSAGEPRPDRRERRRIRAVGDVGDGEECGG